MSLRPIPLAPTLLLAGGMALGACDRTPPPPAQGVGQDSTVRPDFGPTAAYDRLFVFLGAGERLPMAAVFDFTTLSDSSAVRRGERARVMDGSEWVPLLDTGWRSEPLREPWRIVPHGPLHLMVGDGGEFSALVVRGDPAVRLEPGTTLAEDSPDAATQLVLRRAVLRLDGQPTEGVLLDAQRGRSVSPALARELARSAAEADSVAEAGRARADGLTPPGASEHATAVARRGAEGLLLDDTGYYVVFAAAADGDMAWIHDAGSDDVRRDARLEPTAWDDFHEAGVEFPTGWRVHAPGAELAGELKAEAADRSVLRVAPDLAAIGYVVVSGWIEDRGMRHAVFGLVRQVR